MADVEKANETIEDYATKLAKVEAMEAETRAFRAAENEKVMAEQAVENDKRQAEADKAVAALGVKLEPLTALICSEAFTDTASALAAMQLTLGQYPALYQAVGLAAQVMGQIDGQVEHLKRTVGAEWAALNV